MNIVLIKKNNGLFTNMASYYLLKILLRNIVNYGNLTRIDRFATIWDLTLWLIIKVLKDLLRPFSKFP